MDTVIVLQKPLPWLSMMIMTKFSIFNLHRMDVLGPLLPRESHSCPSPHCSLCCAQNTHKCSVPQRLILESPCMLFHLPGMVSTSVLPQGSFQTNQPHTVTVVSL